MNGVGDDSRGRSWGGPWFVVGVALAVGATVALVLADDIRYLRLGIVAALWAALVGAFVAVRYRKQATSTEETVAQAQEVYELELEREIAARREYELEIEAEVRQRAEDDSRAQLEALRAEIGALRDNLQSLFGGEVLLERLSLTAQATRMRALREEQKLVESPASTSRPALTAAKKSDLVDRPTELIERVREKQPARPGGRTAAPEPRRPERSLDLPPRRVAKGEPISVRQARGAAVAKSAADAREQTRIQRPAVAKQPPAPTPAPAPTPTPTELMRPALGRAETSRPAMNPPAPAKPEPGKADPAEQPTQLAKALDPNWAAEADPAARSRPASDISAAFPVREAPAAGGTSAGNDPRESTLVRKPVEPVRPLGRKRTANAKPVSAVESRAAAGQNVPAEAPNPAADAGRKQPMAVNRREPEVPAAPQKNDPSAEKQTLPEDARQLAQQARPGGRRRRAADEETPQQQPEQSAAAEAGGRRRRAEGSAPAWMQPAAADNGRRRAGHSRPELEPVPEPAAGGFGAATGEAGDAGSHSAGRSVTELLAAHGSDAAAPRRRRRAED
ncbi:MAG TPA: DUF6779 domain-containing protein [Amycolatopsis sp.]|nr:DUF6779 domain-containing protein [Amycolatopsis sp.]